MEEKKHCCETCKHFARWSGVPYCFEDGDQVGISERMVESGCCCWKDENDKTPDIDWP